MSSGSPQLTPAAISPHSPGHPYSCPMKAPPYPLQTSVISSINLPNTSVPATKLQAPYSVSPSCPSKGLAGMFVWQVDGRNGQGRKFRKEHPDLEASLSRRSGLSLDGMTVGNQMQRRLSIDAVDIKKSRFNRKPLLHTGGQLWVFGKVQGKRLQRPNAVQMLTSQRFYLFKLPICV